MTSSSAPEYARDACENGHVASLLNVRVSVKGLVVLHELDDDHHLGAIEHGDTFRQLLEEAYALRLKVRVCARDLSRPLRVILICMHVRARAKGRRVRGR
jgi:hypothetical protein